MASNTRHGRRIPLPSTRQIRHELLVMADREAARSRLLARAADEAAPPPEPLAPDRFGA